MGGAVSTTLLTVVQAVVVVALAPLSHLLALAGIWMIGAVFLEYSGPYLAVMELASAVKLATCALLLANLLVPAGLLTTAAGPLALVLAVPAAAAKLAAAMGVLALLESSMAKMRLDGLPEFFFGALFLGLTSLGIGLMSGFK